MSQKVIGIECTYSLRLIEIPYDENSDYAVGDEVVFKDEEEKEELGVIKYVNREGGKGLAEDVLDLHILRKATAHDLQKMENQMAKSEHALEVCQELIAKHDLVMQVFRAGYSFDGTKVHFMFTADDRVDFRELVKDLAKALQKQIHLRQIGPRDKARFIGGYGKCGRTLCCKTFLGKIDSVNMEMVRVQGLESKGSSKLSGACGKLFCCLKYEVEAYKDLRDSLPTIGSIIKLKKSSEFSGNEGRIIALDVLNQKMKVSFPDGEGAIVEAKDIDKVVKKSMEVSARDTREEIPEESPAEAVTN